MMLAIIDAQDDVNDALYRFYNETLTGSLNTPWATMSNITTTENLTLFYSQKSRGAFNTELGSNKV